MITKPRIESHRRPSKLSMTMKLQSSMTSLRKHTIKSTTKANPSFILTRRKSLKEDSVILESLWAT